MKEIHILDVVANYNNKKIHVTIKRKTKEFKLQEFYALHGKKRLAKSGQILYLINPPSVTKDIKKVRYGLKIKPELDNNLISANVIQWSFNGENQYYSTAKTNVTRSLEENDNIITTSVTAGNPNSLEKSVDVKWVEQEKEIKSYTNKLKNFLDFFKVINKVSDAVSKVAPCEVSFFENFDKNTKFQWVNFNTEDPVSRHVLDHKKFEFTLSAANLAKLKCGKKFEVTIFGYSLDLGELYAQLGAGIDVSITNDKLYYHEGNKFKESLKFSRGGISIKGEVGLKVGASIKDNNGDIIVGIEGGGKISITGGGRIEYPFQDNLNEIAGELYVNPLMYEFIATAKFGPLEKEFKYSDVLLEVKVKEQVIYNMETGEMR